MFVVLFNFRKKKKKKKRVPPPVIDFSRLSPRYVASGIIWQTIHS